MAEETKVSEQQVTSAEVNSATQEVNSANQEVKHTNLSRDLSIRTEVPEFFNASWIGVSDTISTRGSRLTYWALGCDF